MSKTVAVHFLECYPREKPILAVLVVLVVLAVLVVFVVLVVRVVLVNHLVRCGF